MRAAYSAFRFLSTDWRKSTLDIKQLAILIKAKGGNRSLREIAQDIDGVSLSTLSRIMNGKMLDVDTFLRLCDWLEVAPQVFIKAEPKAGRVTLRTLEQIELLLHEDQLLDPETVESLIHLIKVVYFAKTKERSER